jgi:hypothetical protein
VPNTLAVPNCQRHASGRRLGPPPRLSNRAALNRLGQTPQPESEYQRTRSLTNPCVALRDRRCIVKKQMNNECSIVGAVRARPFRSCASPSPLPAQATARYRHE